jgi:lambda family phage holin
MKMPEKDPGLWTLIFSVPPAIQGAVMAAVIALLRIVYDRKERKPIRILLEALICGALSLSATSMIDVFGWPPTVSVMIGGTIGFIGVEQMREFALRWIGNRADRG